MIAVRMMIISATTPATVAVRFPAFGFPTIISSKMRAEIGRDIRFVLGLPDLAL
jgi:hypothetical protein